MKLKVKTKIKLDKNKLNKTVADIVVKHAENLEVTITCPHCEQRVKLKQGHHPCPRCTEPIHLTFDTSDMNKIL